MSARWVIDAWSTPSGKVKPQIACRLGVKKPGTPDTIADILASELPKMEDGQTMNRSCGRLRPKFAQAGNAIARFVAGDQGAVDGADRRADDPPGSMPPPSVPDRRRLAGAERATALQTQDHLPLMVWLWAGAVEAPRRARTGHGLHGRTLVKGSCGSAFADRKPPRHPVEGLMSRGEQAPSSSRCRRLRGLPSRGDQRPDSTPRCQASGNSSEIKPASGRDRDDTGRSRRAKNAHPDQRPGRSAGSCRPAAAADRPARPRKGP